jgi:hypothetical protein
MRAVVFDGERPDRARESGARFGNDELIDLVACQSCKCQHLVHGFLWKVSGLATNPSNTHEAFLLADRANLSAGVERRTGISFRAADSDSRRHI